MTNNQNCATNSVSRPCGKQTEPRLETSGVEKTFSSKKTKLESGCKACMHGDDLIVPPRRYNIRDQIPDIWRLIQVCKLYFAAVQNVDAVGVEASFDPCDIDSDPDDFLFKLFIDITHHEAYETMQILLDIDAHGRVTVSSIADLEWDGNKMAYVRGYQVEGHDLPSAIQYFVGEPSSDEKESLTDALRYFLRGE